MRNFKIIILGTLFFLLAITLWISEPIGLNPFAKPQPSFAVSALKFECANKADFQVQFQSKADSLINGAVLLNDFIGVSAGIYKDGCGTYLASAGYSEKSSQTKIYNQTLHRTASIAKSMTAIAIMQLVEDGTLQLDVPIQTYLPEYPKKSKGEISIRQLLKHTSGVEHYSSYWDGISFTYYDNMVDALEEFKHRPLSFVPGTDYEYTTYGYTILGAIIEKVSHKSYGTHMRERVWLPAGMSNTSVEEHGKTYEDKASLYIKLGDRYIKSPKTDLSVKVPGGGLQTTAEDLLLFGKAILENKLIDSTTLLQMVNATDSLKQGTPYGFGWFVIEDDERGRIIQHGGSQSGTSTFLRIYLDKGIVTTALANNFGSDDEIFFLSRDLGKLALQEDQIKKAIKYYRPIPKEALVQFVGMYKRGDDVLNILNEGEQLLGQYNKYPPLKLFPMSSDRFFYRVFDGEVQFTFEGDIVSGIEMHDDGGVSNFEKV